MDELDERLRGRLKALADAVPDASPERPRGARGTPPQIRARFAPGLAVTGAIAIALVALAFGPRSTLVGTAPTASAFTPVPSASLVSGSVPPSGVSIDLAVARAKDRVSADAVLVGARAGRFRDVDTDSEGVAGNGSGNGPVPEEQMVWAVKFAAMFEICPPDGSACWSPRPGWTTVIVDFYSGEVLSSFGYAPNPHDLRPPRGSTRRYSRLVESHAFHHSGRPDRAARSGLTRAGPSLRYHRRHGAWRSGSARALGARGCGFESRRPDQIPPRRPAGLRRAVP